jgi:branched-chain amino acid transport system substrate-binding protein
MINYAIASPSYKIGLLVPLSGAYANEGRTIRDGFFLKLKEANYQVGNTKIEVIVEDTEAKPAVGVTKARKLVEKDKVDILTGCYSSAVGLAVRDYVHEQKVPLVILGGSVALALSYEKKSPYVYRCSTAAGQYLAGFADYLFKEMGYKKGALMAPDYAYGHDLLKVFTKDFTRLGGKVVQTTFVPFPTLDFAPYLSKVDPQAEFLYGEFAGSDAVRLVKQYKDYGMWKKMPLVGGAIVMQELLEAEGDSALGIVGAMFYSTEIDNPENRAFVKAFMSEYKQVATALAASAYEGGTAILMALKEIERNIHDREAFLKALSKVSFSGPRGPFSFEAETNNVIHNNYILKVVKKEGSLVLDVLKTYPATRASHVKALLSD